MYIYTAGFKEEERNCVENFKYFTTIKSMSKYGWLIQKSMFALKLMPCHMFDPGYY